MFTSQFQLPKNYQILKFINTCLSMKIKLIEVLLCRQIFEWWWQSWYFKLWELRILWNTFLIRLKWFHFQNPVSLSFCTSRENKNNFVNDVLSCSYLSRFFCLTFIYVFIYQKPPSSIERNLRRVTIQCYVWRHFMR